MWAHEAIASSLSGLTLGFLTRGLGWTMEEVELFLVGVRKEMKDTKVHAWMPMYACIQIIRLNSARVLANKLLTDMSFLAKSQRPMNRQLNALNL